MVSGWYGLDVKGQDFVPKGTTFGPPCESQGKVNDWLRLKTLVDSCQDCLDAEAGPAQQSGS